jgi:myo-inositol-1(or 4)-monophosphatase
MAFDLHPAPLSDSAALAQSATLMAVAREAALLVREPLLAAFRSVMDIDYKVDLHDLVTVHDKQTELTLRNFIFERVPASTFMGEEGGSVGDGPVHWYVDPIDGTSNFARGIAFWCVSIGAVIDGEIVAGVIFDPVTGNLLSADLSGAWLNGEPLRSGAIAEEARATLITGYPVSRDFRLDGKQEALAHFGVLTETFSTLRCPGSAALSLCHVAAGWADAAVGFGVNPWDVTAGVRILRQAGGSYRALTLGKVASGAADFTCPGYVATGAGGSYPILDGVADAIQSHRVAAAGSR